MAPLKELSAGIASALEELEMTREILIAMVEAKRAGIAHPEAWAAAMRLVDGWGSEGTAAPRSDVVTCPECEAVLVNPAFPEDAPEAAPIRIDCGPIHVLHFASFTAHVQPGGVRIVTNERREAMAPSIKVFDEESETDGDVPGGDAGRDTDERKDGEAGDLG